MGVPFRLAPNHVQATAHARLGENGVSGTPEKALAEGGLPLRAVHARSMMRSIGVTCNTHQEQGWTGHFMPSASSDRVYHNFYT